MTPPTGTHHLAPEHEADANAAMKILLDPELEPIVDMVLVAHDDRGGEAGAGNAAGSDLKHRPVRRDWQQLFGEGQARDGP